MKLVEALNLIGFVLVVLKVTETGIVADWSWFLILAPFVQVTVPVAIFAASILMLIVCFIIGFIVALGQKLWSR